MNTCVRICGLLALSLFALLSACDAGPDSLVAEVGDSQITKSYFEAKWAKMYANNSALFPDSLSLEEQQDLVVDALINKELMVLQARLENIKDKTAYDLAYDGQKNYRLIELLKNQEIVDKIPDFTEEDLLKQFEMLGHSADVRHIDLNTEAEALEVHKKLQSGELDFNEAVSRYSIADDVGAGGRMTIGFGASVEPVEEALFLRDAGFLSGPVAVYGKWSIFLVDRPIYVEPSQTFEQVKAQIRKRLETRALRTNGRVHGDYVLDKFGFHFNEEAALRVLPLMPDDITPSQARSREFPNYEKPILKFSEEELSMLLYKLEGESFTLADFSDEFDGLSPYSRPQKAGGMASFKDYIRRKAINQLMPKEAVDKGLDKHPDYVVAMKEFDEQYFMNSVKSLIVDSEIEMSDAHILQWYEDHLKAYTRKSAVKCKQLVTREEGPILEAKDRLDGGEEFDLVARDLAVNFNRGYVSGFFSPDTLMDPSNDLYRNVARLQEIGEKTPIFQYQGYWAIFQLLETSPPVLLPFEDVKGEVRKNLFEHLSMQRLDSLLASWRGNTVVKIHEKVLRKTQRGEAPNPLRDVY
ncbi:MAG: hypothetical protein QGG80_03645 [Candidatus Krumholzibacteria bacterium]|jgi:hypothetical protein|nr:hypothetical protein [Candidatus Krumholzibacteria bacterium]MDP7022205.1 hypothetical protein [Candidatus Krumholzibacteria bacterium]